MNTDPAARAAVRGAMGLPVVGMVGGGQLSRMTHQAAIALGLSLRVLADSTHDSAALVATGVVVGEHTSLDDLRAFAQGCAAVTVESEWAPVEALARAAPGVAIWPSPETLEAVRHKGRQRDALAAAGLPQPPYTRAATRAGAQCTDDDSVDTSRVR